MSLFLQFPRQNNKTNIRYHKENMRLMYAQIDCIYTIKCQLTAILLDGKIKFTNTLTREQF